MKRSSLISTLFITLFLTANSYAHTGLKSSVPINNAILMESPEVIEMDFTAEVHLTKVELVSKMNAQVIDIGFTPKTTASASYSVPIPELAMGEYHVNWVLLGGDGHQMTGSFSFQVGSADMLMMSQGNEGNAGVD